MDHQFAYSNMVSSAEKNHSNGKKPTKSVKDYEACVFTLCEVYGEIFDQDKGDYIYLAGVLSVVEKSFGVFIEWKPCEPNGIDMAVAASPQQQLLDQDDTEWVIEEAEEVINKQSRSSMPRLSPSQSTQQQQQNEKKTTRCQKYCFSADLGSLRSFIHGNLKKGSGPVWVRFICKDGMESDNYHLRGGGYESLINCLQRYLFLNRSARADNLVIISDSRTEALEKSVGMLNLDKKDIVTRFLANPYATSMTLASKVTSALAPLLDPNTVISESQLHAVRQEQKFAGEDEGSKLRSHNEAGFEHIFQLDLPARPKILHRDAPVDEAQWQKFRSLNGDGRIADSHGLKSLIFRGGIVPAMRPTIWKYMLGYYKWECSDAENEKQRKRLKEDYYRMKLQWTTITEDQESRNGSYRDRKALVEKDVARTDRSHPFFSRTKPENLKLLRDVLMTYCMYDFDLGYVQGMSDFIAVLCIILKSEEDIFWCFVGLMKIVHKNFEMDQVHIKTQLSNLKSLIEIVNPRLANYLEAHDSDHMYFCFRWILVWFKRELSIEYTQHLWEILWTGIPCRAFLLLFCVAILDAQADVIIENKFGLTEILKHINNMSMRIDVQTMLCISEAIYHQLAAVQDKLPRHICEILSFDFGDKSKNNNEGGENGNKIGELVKLE